MLKNFMGLFSRKAQQPIPAAVRRWLMPTAEAEQWEMPDPQVYGNQAHLYRTLSYIGTVVDIVGDACVDTDLDIIDKTTEKENDDHPLMQLLDNPNPYDSRTEFLGAHYRWRKISGNSYWFLNRASAKVAPDEIWILPPAKIIPVPDGRMGLRGYLYRPGNGAEIPLETWEVMHFKSFNPFSRYLGLSAIESLAMTAEGAKAAQEWNTRLFAENNARLPGILAFAEMIQDADWDKMKKEVANAAAKRNNMMLRGVGKGGVEWMQGSATQREMEFLEGLDRSMREIYDRLAPGLYNMLTSNSSFANGQTGMAAFARWTLNPLLRETADKLTAELLSVFGDGYKAEYEDVVPEDKEIKMREIELFSRFHTLDEVRVEMFKNKKIGDERGDLIASQITAASGQPEPPVGDAQADVPQDTQPQAETMTPEPEPEDDTQDEQVKADLLRWKRKARRAFGTAEAHTFTDSTIPAELHAQIVDGIKAAKSADELEGVFNVAPQDSIKALAAAIERAVNEIASPV